MLPLEMLNCATCPAGHLPTLSLSTQSLPRDPSALHALHAPAPAPARVVLAERSDETKHRVCADLADPDRAPAENGGLAAANRGVWSDDRLHQGAARERIWGDWLLGSMRVLLLNRGLLMGLGGRFDS